MELLEKFIETMRSRRKARVLELGTLRSIPTRPTHHRDSCAPGREFRHVGYDAWPRCMLAARAIKRAAGDRNVGN